MNAQEKEKYEKNQAKSIEKLKKERRISPHIEMTSMEFDSICGLMNLRATKNKLLKIKKF